VATLKTVTFVEERYGIEVEAHEAGVENFDTIDSIAAFVNSKEGRRGLSRFGATLSHLAQYLEASAERFPERLAAADPDGTSLTYRELNERAGRIADFWRGGTFKRATASGWRCQKPPAR